MAVSIFSDKNAVSWVMGGSIEHRGAKLKPSLCGSTTAKPQRQHRSQVPFDLTADELAVALSRIGDLLAENDIDIHGALVEDAQKMGSKRNIPGPGRDRSVITSHRHAVN